MEGSKEVSNLVWKEVKKEVNKEGSNEESLTCESLLPLFQTQSQAAPHTTKALHCCQGQIQQLRL